MKLWVNEFLDGTTRLDMTGAQRAFWCDLLCLGGRSRIPGVICSGETNGKILGFPIIKLKALALEEIDVEQTLRLFVETGKVETSYSTAGTVKLVTIKICKWEKYQSEYHRQKKYRETRVKKNGKVTNKVTSEKTSKLPVEEEGDVEVEGDERQGNIAAAFSVMNCEPYGPKEFRRIWLEEWTVPGNPSFADAMERAAQRCASLRIKVPGRFFAHKREIEKIEAEKNYEKKRP